MYLKNENIISYTKHVKKKKKSLYVYLWNCTGNLLTCQDTIIIIITQTQTNMVT